MDKRLSFEEYFELLGFKISENNIVEMKDFNEGCCSSPPLEECCDNIDDMVSIFDYLGRPGGIDLGSKVFKYAKVNKINIEFRMINNSKYKGKVCMYPKTFLDHFFTEKARYESETKYFG